MDANQSSLFTKVLHEGVRVTIVHLPTKLVLISNTNSNFFARNRFFLVVFNSALSWEPVDLYGAR